MINRDPTLGIESAFTEEWSVMSTCTSSIVQKLREAGGREAGLAYDLLKELAKVTASGIILRNTGMLRYQGRQSNPKERAKLGLIGDIVGTPVFF